MRNNKKMGKKYIAGILACALIAGSMSSMDVSAAKKISLSSKKITINKGGSKTIKVKNIKKKVKWKIVSGKANITLKKKGKAAASIKGKKKGTAKVQAIVGKKKLTCKVTVKEGKTEAPSSSAVPTLQPVTTNPGTNAGVITTPAVSNAPQTPAPTTVVSNQPTATPIKMDENEVAALKKIIYAKRDEGATVSDDLTCDEYEWEDGKLIGINWKMKVLIGDLDMSGFPNLVRLQCEANMLESLNVSQNLNLRELNCVFNTITTLDLTNNKKLSKLTCDDVKIIGYHPSEGADENDVAAIKKIISEQLKLGATVSEDLDNQQYQWEDGRLIGIVWKSKNLSGELDVSAFPKLQGLFCASNELNKINIAQNPELEELECSANKLTELDVSQNPELEELECYANKLTELDVSQNPELKDLECSHNELTELDVSQNPKLQELNCSANELSKLDVSENVALMQLWCYGNGLTSLDVSQNPELKRLNCSEGRISNLDISQNINLEYLDCSGCEITVLDASKNTKLKDLFCDEAVNVIGYDGNRASW